jgi:phage-related protein/uncharacterized coiled-coil DUF342 family protein
MPGENDLSGKVGLDTTGFKKGITELNAQVRSIETGFRASAAVMDDWSSTSGGLTSRIDSLNQKLDLQKQKLSILNDEYQKTVKEQGANSSAAQSLANQMYSTERSIGSTEKQLNNYKNRLNETQSPTAGLQDKISSMNQDIEVSNSKFRAATSGMDDWRNSSDGLKAKLQNLNETHDVQNKKLDELTKAYADVVDQEGANSSSAKDLSVKINDTCTEMNKTKAETKEFTEELDNLDKGSKKITFDGFKDGLKKVGEGAVKVAKGVAVAGAAMAAAAAGAAAKLGKEVVKSYADYEQLVGGVDTLFKKSSKTVQNYASNAYKTAGLSANQYMDTVTSFSASLISSLHGDTAKAAKVADMAITDMSDNANKMGTDMSSIQNAYQGFAKQNYTMLDNLKLGYGGTKKEMERLLADAEKFSGVHYDIKNYSDVAEAIHVIQTNMGITGTTAKEATETISGSISSLKSAFSNFITGLGDSNANISQLTDNLVGSFKNVVKNITPILGNIVKALPDAVNALLEAVVELLPVLLDTVSNLFSEMLTTIVGLLPQLIPVAVEAVMTIVNSIIENLPQLINAGMQAISSLVNGLIQALPNIVQAAITIILSLVNSLSKQLPKLIPAAVNAILTIANTLIKNLPEIIKAATQIIMAVIDGLVKALPQLLAQAPKIITTVINGIVNALPVLIKAAPRIITSIIMGIVNALPTLIKAAPQIIKALIDGMTVAIPLLLKMAPMIFKALWDGIRRQDWGKIGGDIVRGLWNGIKNLCPWIMRKLGGFGQDLLDGLKKKLGIHSPSTVFRDQVGKNLALGVEEGFTKNMKGVADDMAAAIPTDFDTDINPHVNNPRRRLQPAITGVESVPNDYSTLVTGNNFYVRNESDIDKIAQAIERYKIRKYRGVGAMPT